MKWIVTGILLTFVSGLRLVSAQPIYPENLMRLRIIGTLLPAEEQKREDLILVDIFVQDKPWRLRIGKVEELNPSGREEKIKEDILLRQVRFHGPESLLARFQQGKVLTIEGQLDKQQRRFLVTAVQDGTKLPEKK